MLLYVLSLFAVLGLFAMTQLRSVDQRAGIYLLSTFILILVLLGWQLSITLGDYRATKLRLLAGYSLVMAVLSVGVMVAVSLYGQGFMRERIMPPAAFMQVTPGLIWGLFIGYLLKIYSFRTQTNEKWIHLLSISSVVVAIFIGTSIFRENASQVPDLRVFARKWDDQHRLLLQSSANGDRRVELPSLRYDGEEFIWSSLLVLGQNGRCPQAYYGIEEIVIHED